MNAMQYYSESKWPPRSLRPTRLIEAIQVQKLIWINLHCCKTTSEVTEAIEAKNFALFLIAQILGKYNKNENSDKWDNFDRFCNSVQDVSYVKGFEVMCITCCLSLAIFPQCILMYIEFLWGNGKVSVTTHCNKTHFFVQKKKKISTKL